MGIFTQISNRKRKTLEKHSLRKKRLLKAEKKKLKGQLEVEVPNVNLLSQDQLRNKLKHPLNNIDISKKKMNRALKRLKHQQKRVEETEEAEEEEGEDADMAETEDSSDKPGTSGTSSSTVIDDVADILEPKDTAVVKKKRTRGGRKKNKGKATAAAGKAQDVEMEEM